MRKSSISMPELREELQYPDRGRHLAREQRKRPDLRRHHDASEFRGMKIGGVKLPDILLHDLLLQIPEEKWVVTYSPDIPEKRTAEVMHLRHGARSARASGRSPGLQQPRCRGHGLPAAGIRCDRRGTCSRRQRTSLIAADAPLQLQTAKGAPPPSFGWVPDSAGPLADPHIHIRASTPGGHPKHGST